MYKALLLCTALFALSLGVLPREKKRAFLEECEKTHKTGLDIDEILDKWLIPTSEKGKCLMECFVLKKGLVDEQSNINHVTATPHFVESFPGEPENVKKAEQALAKCDELDISKLDHCSKAVEVLKCFRKNAKELGLKH